MIQLIYDLADYFNQKQGRKYPCSNQVVICVYVTDNQQEVYNYLDKNNIIPIIISKARIEWQENNERWVWFPITQNIRGYRFYKIKISKNYNDEEKLKKIIIPYCSLYCCSWEVME